MRTPSTDQASQGARRARRVVLALAVATACVIATGSALGAESGPSSPAPPHRSADAAGAPGAVDRVSDKGTGRPEQYSGPRPGDAPFGRRVVFPADQDGDSGLAVDLLGVDISHDENDAGSASDDRIDFFAAFANPGATGALADGDLLEFYVSNDASPATGDPFPVDGAFGTSFLIEATPFGAEYLIELSRDLGVIDGRLFRFDRAANDYVLVRSLNLNSDYLFAQPDAVGNGGVLVTLPASDLGIGRNQAFSTLVRTSYDYRDAAPADEDYAPGALPFYTLSTPLAPERPAIAPGNPGGITHTSATLNGVVDPNRLPTTYFFQFGPTTAYGLQSPASAAGAGDAGVGATATIGGLLPNTTYHYRLVASNAAGQSVGPDQVLTTARLRRNQVLGAVAGPLRCGRGLCYLRKLQVTVRFVDPNRGRAIKTPAALQNARVKVLCVRGCDLNRTIALRPGTVRVRALSAASGRFLGTSEGSPGRRVGVSITLRGGVFRINLTPLFTDGRGHKYLLRRGGPEIHVIFTKPGYAGAASIIRVQPSTKRLTCGLRNGRPVACREA
jgi:hypothetical protein